MRVRRWLIQLSLALFLSSARTTYHGDCFVSVYENILSLAMEYSTHLSRINIHRADLPSFCRVFNSILKSFFLFMVTNREPIFYKDCARPDKHFFEFRT